MEKLGQIQVTSKKLTTSGIQTPKLHQPVSYRSFVAAKNLELGMALNHPASHGNTQVDTVEFELNIMLIKR